MTQYYSEDRNNYTKDLKTKVLSLFKILRGLISMKKLKILCAIVGIASMMCATPSFAANQKYEVPEYNPNDVKKFSLESMLIDGRKIRTENGYVDRNKDGKTDLFLFKGYVDEIPEIVKLYVDDNFDGVADRELTDYKKADGTFGVDGIYDREEPSDMFLSPNNNVE